MGLLFESGIAACFGILAVASWKWDIRRYGAPAILALVTLDLALGFGIGGIYYYVNASEARVVVSPNAMLQASLLGLLGAVTLAFGYVAPGKLYAVTKFGGGAERWLAHSDRLVAVCLLEMVGWLARIQQFATGSYFHIRDDAEAGSSVVIIVIAGLPTVAALLVLNRRWEAGRPAGIAWLLVVCEMAWFLPAGARAPIIGLILALVLLRRMLGYRVNKAALVVVGVLCVTILFPFVSAYRGNDSSYTQDINTSASQALRSTLFGGQQGLISKGMDSTFSRFSDVLSAAVVFQERNVIEGRPGAPFVDYLVTMAAPRSIYPSKPDPGTYGNEFGRLFGLVRATDDYTSIAVSQPLHAYLEGGWLLVSFAGLMSGFLYRCFAEFLLGKEPRIRRVLLASFAFATATSIGTIWPLGFAGMVKAMALTIICMSVAGGAAGALVRHPEPNGKLVRNP